MADKPEMFGPTRGFLGMADSMEPYKMLCGRPNGNKSWARRGDAVAYRLVLLFVGRSYHEAMIRLLWAPSMKVEKTPVLRLAVSDVKVR